MFAGFCREIGLFTDLDKELYINRTQEAAEAIMGATGQKVREERYSQKFISALRDALSTGFAYISDSKANPRRVGWQDHEFVYLINGALSVVNQWLRNSGEPPINIPTKEIRKQLFNDGLTFSTEARVNAAQYDLQRTDPADESKPMVTAIYRTRFYNIEISKEEKAA